MEYYLDAYCNDCFPRRAVSDAYILVCISVTCPPTSRAKLVPS
jgi:hypothetical protein